MTFPAIHGFVFSLQGKISPAVVKILNAADALKSIFIVTFSAIATEFTLMHVLMTGTAGCRQNADLILKNNCRCRFHLMTFPAIDQLVLSFELELGLIVIETAQASRRGK